MLFVDDDTDVVSDRDPEKLMNKIQKEADLSCNWLTDNRMCVAGEKSKLLIVGTKELRKSKIGDHVQSILVDGKRVVETRSEKLLGVVINNKMTWERLENPRRQCSRVNSSTITEIRNTEEALISF